MNNNKYQLGKIYTIRHPDTDKFYIGSTCQEYLSRRFASHKSDYKSSKLNISKIVTSKIIFDFGFDDCYIELLESYPCNSKEELEKREGELIRLHKNNLVNKRVEGRNIKAYGKEYSEEHNEEMKKYREEHKEEIKKYREEHKEEIKKYNKKYREEHKEKMKKYCEEHKEEIKKYNKKYYEINKL